MFPLLCAPVSVLSAYIQKFAVVSRFFTLCTASDIATLNGRGSEGHRGVFCLDVALERFIIQTVFRAKIFLIITETRSLQSALSA
jgi:hypothetical protein